MLLIHIQSDHRQRSNLRSMVSFIVDVVILINSVLMSVSHFQSLKIFLKLEQYEKDRYEYMSISSMSICQLITFIRRILYF